MVLGFLIGGVLLFEPSVVACSFLFRSRSGLLVEGCCFLPVLNPELWPALGVLFLLYKYAVNYQDPPRPSVRLAPDLRRPPLCFVFMSVSMANGHGPRWLFLSLSCR